MAENVKTLKFPYIDHQFELQIDSELGLFLEEIGKKEFHSTLSYVLKEIVGNANKANMKRVHFYVKKLDIGSKSDYNKGIKSFKEQASLNYQNYSDMSKKLGYFVRLDFYISKGYIVLLTSNNSPMLSVEKERFQKKLEKTTKFKSFEDALKEGLDLSEGAGFGLILSVMMLRKLGLDNKYFRLLDKDKFTQLQIVVPLNLVSKKEGSQIAEAVVSVINDIPQFPQHVLELERKIADQNAVFDDLATIISKDPSMIADILKHANSAYYMLPRKVSSIKEAVKLIGFGGLKNLVIAYTTNKLLMNTLNIKSISRVMEHSYEVGFIAFNLAKNLNKKMLLDDIYLIGLLHDIGKIIIKGVQPGLMEKITEICNKKGISSDILEGLTNGYNHSIIGAKLAEKWNFPHTFVETILYHHIPQQVESGNRDFVYAVYLADRIYYYKRKLITFDGFDKIILKEYNLSDQQIFDEQVDKIYKLLENRLDDRK